jgi:hypothetical protein
MHLKCRLQPPVSGRRAPTSIRDRRSRLAGISNRRPPVAWVGDGSMCDESRPSSRVPARSCRTIPGPRPRGAETSSEGAHLPYTPPHAPLHAARPRAPAHRLRHQVAASCRPAERARRGQPPTGARPRPAARAIPLERRDHRRRRLVERHRPPPTRSCGRLERRHRHPPTRRQRPRSPGHLLRRHQPRVHPRPPRRP